MLSPFIYCCMSEQTLLMAISFGKTLSYKVTSKFINMNFDFMINKVNSNIFIYPLKRPYRNE